MIERVSDEQLAVVISAGGGPGHEMALDLRDARRERDEARARVKALEPGWQDLGGKALAYDDLHRGDFHDRAHKLAQQDARDAGRNVWHIAVERAEKAEAALTAERAKVARLREALCAWKERVSSAVLSAAIPNHNPKLADALVNALVPVQREDVAWLVAILAETEGA